MADHAADTAGAPGARTHLTEEDAALVEAGRLLFASECRFVYASQRLDQLPVPSLPEIAFAGRSNVGKSSLLNALTGRRALARVSHEPGRTRQLNFFDLGGHSLQAIRLIAEIASRLNRQVSIAQLFKHQTLCGFAALLDEPAVGAALAGPASPAWLPPGGWSSSRLAWCRGRGRLPDWNGLRCWAGC